MRQHMGSANALQSKADQLTNRYLFLKAATTNIRMCVLCSRSAMEACDRADGEIAQQNSM